jgi:hypothetical protein
MVWYGATDPRGKLDFFEMGGVLISAITSQFFSFFRRHIATKISHHPESLQPTPTLRYSPFAVTHFVPLSLHY